VRRTLYEADHEDFRETVRAFVAKEIVPHDAEWNAAGIVPRELFTAAAEQGLLGWAIPEEFGGGGVADFRFNAVLVEELWTAGIAASGNGLSLVNDVCLPYFLDLATDEQKQRWLPGIARGELITAIAMTEPAAGSPRSARRPAGTATTSSSTARRPSSPTGSTPTSSSQP
jgi:alkylation response protein AidB-like acyl-CoA dehydrogenase